MYIYTYRYIYIYIYVYTYIYIYIYKEFKEMKDLERMQDGFVR